eukprot:TRINITY_DN1470_c0_g1_i4.p1 TRINITY_DN1470_c0_g1~~TRINITY_DN1470_c0_g1_i4.p1  ORF type:complete len:363 (-),score=70.00 TRINITY_DN1470_c0_g1_i4:145-1233(-)
MCIRDRFGTRLRPLTFSVPKPFIEFANIPIVAHQIKALAKVGVKEIILAINYQQFKPETVESYFKRFEEEYKVKIICSPENEPLGTAGPIRLAKDLLTKDNEDGLFFVFNSDVICEFPLSSLIDFHKKHNKEGTLFVTEVKDPSRYGVILYDEAGKIANFIEKPQTFVSNKINAGMYLLNTKMIDRIPMKPTSIEREVFPLMAKDEQLYCFLLEGFWMDIGQPKDFVEGNSLYLNFLRKSEPQLLSDMKNMTGNVLIDKSAQIHENASIGPNVTIGKNCIIEDGAKLTNCVVFSNSQIGAHSYLNQTIIGWKSKIGKWCRLEGGVILGEDVDVKNEIYLNGTIVLPHKAINANQPTAGTILL